MTATGDGWLAALRRGDWLDGERTRVYGRMLLLFYAVITVAWLVLSHAGLDLTGRESLVETLAELVADEDAAAVVLVTHHLEEIPPGMTHALLLKDGRIVAAGPIDGVLTDELLSETFDMPLHVTHDEGRWSARVRRAAASGEE